MKIRKSLWTLVALLVSLVSLAQPGQSSRLSRDSILIGDRVDWTADIVLAPGEELYMEPMSDPVVAGVETVEQLKIDTISTKKGSLALQAKMTLTSFDSGSYVLPNIVAAVARANGQIDTLVFDGAKLAVNTIPIDTATYVIKDIKAQINYPLTLKELLPWIGGVLLLAALVFLIIRLIKARKENTTLFGKPIVADPAHIVALRSLEKIRKQKLWQNEKQKQFYTAVTDTLRVYIAERFHIATLERSSTEMLSDLKKQDVDENMYGKIAELFTRADLVKFAKYQSSNEENEDTIPVAVQFVNTTYMTELKEEK